MARPKRGSLSPSKSKIKTVPKSRKNTSGRPSAAKRASVKPAAKKATQSKQRVAKGLPYKKSGLNPQQPKQLPETSQTLKGLTLRKLLRNTPRLMVNNATDVNVIKLSKTNTRSGMPAIQSVTLTDDPWRPVKVKRPHDTFIIGLDTSPSHDPLVEVPVNKHKRVIVSCNCISGKTKVLTSKGWKTVYSIAEDFNLNKTIKYLVDGKYYHGTAPFYTGRKPTFKLEFSNGESVEATEDHRFLVKESRCDPVWKELRDINQGDNLVLTKAFTDLPDKTSEFYNMQFLGFMQGDGTVTGGPQSKNFDLKVFNSDKFNFCKHFIDMGLVRAMTRRKISGKKAAVYSFNHKAKELAWRYNYDNAGVPCFKTKEQFFGYLSGLISADASVSSKNNKIKSLLLRGSGLYLKPIFEALIRYGFSDTSIRLERKAGTEVNTNRETGCVFEASKDMHCLSISAKSFFELRDYLELSERFYTYAFKPFRPRVLTTKITKKHYSGEQNVYDINVPIVHRFVVNGGVVAHNCEDYVFRWEWANASYGASRIIYGNGDAPVYTNPQFAYGLCKHLVALSVKIIKENL